MPLTIGWFQVTLRLFLAVAAAALIGWDRGEHGKAAGLRTTLLVGLAASFRLAGLPGVVECRWHRAGP
ncbi:MAG TPA: MgtC/SapB family protein [Stellaceae bacterium]|nr:MgtC/SapB family protein [Stellaceae bacterium]